MSFEDQTTVTINTERLHHLIKHLSQIGRKENHLGLYRGAFSPADDQARAWVLEVCNAANIEAYEDEACNIIARIGPKNKPAIATGSHLDTVPGGGHLDGADGVLAGLEAILSIKDSQIPLTHPIEVIAFSDEEGRFGSMIGSKVMCAQSNPQELAQAKDETGRTLAQALQERGKSIEEIQQAQRSAKDFKAFIELHIEQGPVLDQKQIDIGIVENIVGISRWRACYIGQANHAGTTPMEMRQDAIMGFVDFAQQVDHILNTYGSPHARATIGRVVTHPGYIGVIAQKVEFTLDLRDVNQEVLTQLDQALEKHAQQVAKQHRLTFELTRVGQLAAINCAVSLTKYIEKITQDLGYSSHRMMSGALHDCINFSSLTDVAMIFVPSIQGVSHSSLEETKAHHLEQGAMVLTQTLLSLARE